MIHTAHSAFLLSVSMDRGKIISYNHLEFSWNLCLSLVGRSLKLYLFLFCAWKSSERLFGLVSIGWVDDQVALMTWDPFESAVLGFWSKTGNMVMDLQFFFHGSPI